MYCGQDFSPADPDEIDFFGLDFTNDINLADAPKSTVWTCAVAESSSGTDSNPSSRLIGPAIISGNRSIQKVGGLLAGVRYLLTAEITTLGGAVVSLWSYVDCVAPG